MVTVCPSQFATRRTLFHVLVGCGLLMLKVSRLKLPVIWRSEERFSRNAETDLVCRLLLEKKNDPGLQGVGIIGGGSGGVDQNSTWLWEQFGTTWIQMAT